MSARRLRLGMVGGGAGAFVGAVHRIAARIDDRWELVAGVFSSDPERGRRSAADLHVAPDRAYASYAEMAEREAARANRIDAVAIVTPNDLHVAVAHAFVERGFAVICDKPLATSLDDATRLRAVLEERRTPFVVTYNYSGYPMVREARELVRSGALGAIRVVQAEYAQDWLATALEETGQKQAGWRTDPARSGPAGSVGDIGTHAYHLAGFVTGLRCTELLAELATFVPGRRLDDDARMLLRFEGGAQGALWCSQVACGHENALRLRVYGERGGLEWAQEHPNQLRVTAHGEAPRVLYRGMAGLTDAATRATRTPSGHPEGYLEGFAQIYNDAAALIAARLEGAPVPEAASLLPGIEAGVSGVAFIDAAVRSARAGAVWTALGS